MAAPEKGDVPLDNPTIKGYVPFFVAASGAMLFASTGVNNAWPLAWLAPVPLLSVVPNLSWRRAGTSGVTAGRTAAWP